VRGAEKEVCPQFSEFLGARAAPDEKRNGRVKEVVPNFLF
jgi:hypothetical protein